MSLTAFFDDGIKRRTAEAIASAEAKTNAELVVAVRRESGGYLEADLLFGFATALAMLCAMLWLPEPFPLWAFPVDVTLAFVVGAAIGRWIPPLRRLLAWPRARHRRVEHAAKAAFHDLGITRTRARTGILVFASAFEREVVLVPDTGVDVAGLGDAWPALQAGLESAFKRGDPERFLETLAGAGPVLARVVPHTDDDVNELPDAVDAG